jgi:hypothetical protein
MSKVNQKPRKATPQKKAKRLSDVIPELGVFDTPRKECPQWLCEIGRQVDKLIQEPKNKDRFRQVLRRWYNDNARKRKYQLLPLKPREHSVREMYVVLAAVHDACCRQLGAIHPWSKLPRLSTVGVKYFGLMGLAPGLLTPRDEPTLEGFVDAVKGDLAAKIEQAGQEKGGKLPEKVTDVGRKQESLRTKNELVAAIEEAVSTRLNKPIEDLTTAVQNLNPERPAEAGQKGKADNRDGDGLTKAKRSAYQSYEYAVSKAPPLADATDNTVYDWLKENGAEGEYEPPSRETWKRQVRAGRKYHGTQKNTSRAGRDGRSTIKSGQIQSLSEISSQYGDEAD